jgi:transcriptional regulator with XRE-family HTH domain
MPYAIVGGMAEPVGGRLSAALRETVERARLSQVDIAERLGVDQPTVSRWVRGMRRPPLDVLGVVEAMAGVPLGTVLRRAGYVDGNGLDVVAAVEADPVLTESAKRAVIAVYEGFRNVLIVSASDSKSAIRAATTTSPRSRR